MARAATKEKARTRGTARARRRATAKPATRKTTKPASKPASKPAAKTKAATPRRRELLGIVALSAGVTLALALGSFSPHDDARIAAGLPVTHNLIGEVGHLVADALLSTIGLGAFVVALMLVAFALALFARRTVHVTAIEALGYGALMVFGAVLADLLLPTVRPLAHSAGGAVGLVVGTLLQSYLAKVGAVIVALAGVLLSLVVASDVTVARLVLSTVRAALALLRRVGGMLGAQWSRHQIARAQRAQARAARARVREVRAEEKASAETKATADLEADERGILRAAAEETPVDAPATAVPPPVPMPVAAPSPTVAIPAAPQSSSAAGIAPLDDALAIYDVDPVDPLEDPTHADPDWAPSLAVLAAAADAARADAMEGDDAAPVEVEAPGVTAAEATDAPGATIAASDPALAATTIDATAIDAAPPPEAPAPPKRARRPAEIAPVDDAPAKTAPPEPPAGPTIVESKVPERGAKPARQESFAFTTHGEKFILPGLDLLDDPPTEERGAIDKAALHETAKKLTQKLGDFGITGEVRKIRLGPVVTMYEFVPGPGVRISKIAGLADDLAMAMEALQVRIVAPLPGKGAVGIEVPNRDRQTVYLRENLDQETFARAKSKLTLAMGKDVEGMPFCVDLAQMPHLLIAGTTGSGKSVSVNAMITSILYKSTPDDVRFIMIDPKVTELKLYDGIPHLLLPVVDDPAKAALALRWAVDEMERRYQLLADTGVRNLSGYNRVVEKQRTEWEARQASRPPPPPLESVDGDAEAYEALKRAHEEHFLADPPPHERLPLIVIIIDELADLMMVASREVETYVARIAQKARAAGIHLMVATQRPSTDVLTGLIKANFPARIGFRVASRHDSQTIINGPGSEKLLGRGDMLIIPPGQSEPLRVHGAFVADEEIKRVVAHLKSQGQPIYDESILQPRDDEGAGASGEGGETEYDVKWDEAVLLVSERESISVSYLQRRLQVGYNRAARMIEQMERDGIVGPADGSKPREVLVSAPPM